MPWRHQQEHCHRRLSEEEDRRLKRSFCGGLLRTVYVRKMVGGQPQGHTPVGTVCLRCHHVILKEDALPPEPRW
jgi:hypothetical protein